MILTLLFVAVLLLLGVVARSGIAPLRWLHIPGSVVSGFIGLAAVQFTPNTIGEWIASVAGPLKEWPSFLIAVIFAGMLLQRKATTRTVSSYAENTATRVGRQGLMVWIIVLGETTVGLLVTWLIVQQFADVPNSFGMLIETGFAGGHGTAGAMGDVFTHPRINFAAGLDLGMLMATCGLVYGLISGIVWINVAFRRGWVRRPSPSDSHGTSDATLKQADELTSSAKRISVTGGVIDPLLLQVIWLAIALGIGTLLHAAVGQVGIWVSVEKHDVKVTEVVDTGVGESDLKVADDDEDEAGVAAKRQLDKRLSVANLLDGFPLFIFTLAGGLILRWILTAIGRRDSIDSPVIGRLSGIAMDLLVVAAITTLNVSAVVHLAIPFCVLFVAGCVWASICLLVISKWVLPAEHWFQLGLINYGMSTGTTATGFILLRVIDPDLESGAAEDYALAAPLSAPFIGGGLITIALPLLVLEQVAIWIPASILCAVICVLVLIGRLTNRTAIRGASSGGESVVK